MSKAKWLKILLVIPLVFVLVFTNLYQDPANIYHDLSKEIASAMMAGNSVYAGNNPNEREVRRQQIMMMPEEVDCVAVGPSVVLCVDKEVTGTDSFYNLGESGANIYDIMAQLAIMDIYGKKTGRVIICVDPNSLDEVVYTAPGQRSANLMPYTYYMLDLIDGKTPGPVDESKNDKIMQLIEQSFSTTYFQASRDQIVSNGRYNMSGLRWGIVDDNDLSRSHYNSDGSWTYAADFQANNAESVAAHAAQYYIEGQFACGRHLSDYSKGLFEKLIAYLVSEGVDVELFLCPLAPSLWDRLEKEDEYFILDDTTVFAEELCEKYEIKLTGSYDPYELGLSDSDFYDSRHMRKELMGVYFDFTE